MSVTTITTVNENVTNILNMLLGSTATAKPSKGTECPEPRVVATYVDSTGEVQHLILVSIAVANGMGAALTLIPAPRAVDATKSGTVPEGIRENLEEVLNVCVNCFHEDGAARVVLGNVYFPQDSLDPAVAERIATAKKRVVLDVDLKAYGKGVMVLL